MLLLLFFIYSTNVYQTSTIYCCKRYALKSHELHGMFYMWCQMWQELQENCAINAPSSKSYKTAVLVILSMWSLVLHQTAEPKEALWHQQKKVKENTTTEMSIIPIHQEIEKTDQNSLEKQQIQGKWYKIIRITGFDKLQICLQMPHSITVLLTFRSLSKALLVTIKWT